MRHAELDPPDVLRSVSEAVVRRVVLDEEFDAAAYEFTYRLMEQQLNNLLRLNAEAMKTLLIAHWPTPAIPDLTEMSWWLALDVARFASGFIDRDRHQGSHIRDVLVHADETMVVRHVIEEGAGKHVVWFNQRDGRVCSEPDCEVNALPTQEPLP